MKNIKYILSIGFVFTSVFAWSQQVLTPKKAFELALEHNYGVKMSNNAVKVAENNTSILNSGYLPTLTGNAGATYNLDNTTVEFNDGTSRSLQDAESSRYNASLNLNYTLFDGLGRRYNYKRLKEQYALSQLEAKETIENTAYQLFTEYYSIANLAENTNALEQTLAITKDRLTRAKYQFDYGQNTKLAVLNAEVDINNDSINLMNGKQQLNNAKRNLQTILGNKFTDDFKVDTKVDFTLNLQKEDLLNKAKINNVSLLQTNRNITINELNIKSNKSNYLPTIGIIGTYGWNKNNNNAASFAAASTSDGLSGGINLSWNLFDGGSTSVQVKNAKINLENQELQKEQLLITIERDFNNAWDDYQNKIAVYNMQEKNMITSQNNFDRTREKFKIGQATSIEFRQAQLNLLNAEISKNQAKFNAKLSELNILKICGELLNVKF